MLSANSETVINCEYLMEDNDLNYVIKRDEFSKII